jgi:hypothetical protein
MASSGSSEPSWNLEDHPLVTTNDRLSHIGEAIPEFGGMYIDPEASVLYVYMTDTETTNGREERVREEVVQWFGPYTVEGMTIRFRKAEHSMTQLLEWYDRMSGSVLAIDGVNAVDLWEGENRLWVGVSDLDENGAEVLRALRDLGIPEGVMVIEKAGPFGLFAELTDDFDPLEMSGVQIEADGGPGECTLSFITVRDGWETGAVTASHCTDVHSSGGSASTPGTPVPDFGSWYQATTSSGEEFGVETLDGPWFTNAHNSNCPSGDLCRYSDGAFASEVGDLDLQIGNIARPTAVSSSGCASSGSCELTLDSTKPTFPIKAEIATVQGRIVHKVGITTGWTSGEVTHTCLDVDLGAITFLCQDLADFYSTAGDSGAPVFERDSQNADLARIAGILVGPENQQDPQAGDVFFSPIGSVYFELGPSVTWDTCDPTYSC